MPFQSALHNHQKLVGYECQPNLYLRTGSTINVNEPALNLLLPETVQNDFLIACFNPQ